MKHWILKYFFERRYNFVDTVGGCTVAVAIYHYHVSVWGILGIVLAFVVVSVIGESILDGIS